MNKLRELGELGCAVWLDFVDRDLLMSGELERLVREGVTGVTSNPTIFEKAMAKGDAYRSLLCAYDARHPTAPPLARYEHLAVNDIRLAADILRPVYQRLDARDGYVSLEVSPYLAHDTEATVLEVHRLWETVNRPNLMIKIPATPAGISAIAPAIEAGINVNATLIFGTKTYISVAEAFVQGLERRMARGLPVTGVASVASFFVGRIDAAVDAQLDAVGTEAASELKGKIAIANARSAYRCFCKLLDTARWQVLAAAGALPQRLLWASTGTKNPSFPATMYVDELIGPDTVNTMPPATLEAFRIAGTPRRDTVLCDPAISNEPVLLLQPVGIDFEQLVERLSVEGVAAFCSSFDNLLLNLPETRC